MILKWALVIMCGVVTATFIAMARTHAEEMASGLTGAWAVVLFTMLLISHRRTYPRGCCKSCGYNLRSLTENRCPECFTEFDPADVVED